MPFEICSMADTKLHCKVKVAFNHKYFLFYFILQEVLYVAFEIQLFGRFWRGRFAMWF
jgi:hypothetical protein